ncbi:HDOD domain-containing protein [Salinimonas lutimaris]|uniref:HDOD domain-containing protein n=1 Tax=Salinimonas lutimaris TaxID=914153 RepID=UPI0015863A7F|nr:HDOD domain-containing protein [Salinimonas lutimaris]
MNIAAMTTTTRMSPPSVEERFDSLLVCPDLLAGQMGKRRPGEVAFEESEQNFSRRRLLGVEKAAIAQKRRQAESEASFIGRISEQLHSMILQDIESYTADIPHLYAKTLGLTDNIPEMLDVLSTRAASVSRLEPVVASAPWLFDELLHIVNTPKFRRRDSRGRVIPVETLRTALSFLGIENLRMLLPAFVLKRAMPQITDPFPQIKIKTQQFAYGVAVTARTLAPMSDCHPASAFTLGILSTLGRCAVTRQYFKTFETLHRQMLEEAEKQRQPDVHEALTKIRPQANYLIALQEEFADKLTATLFDFMVFQRLPVTNAMAQLSHPTAPVTDPLARLIQQARVYTRVRMLHHTRCIDKDEVRQQLRGQHFARGALDKLKTVDIFSLPLTFDTDPH